MILISIFCQMILLYCGNLSLVFLLTLFFLAKKEIEEIKNHSFYFHKFLLERYLTSFYYKKIKKIDNIKRIKKDVYHYIKVGEDYKSETYVLKQYFQKK